MIKPRGILGLGALAALALAAPCAEATDFTWPVSGRVTQGYWTRVNYIAGGYHRGIDIAGPYWSPVGAARAGSVWRGWGGGYGNLVIVYHEAGYRTYYGHNIRFGQGGRVGRGATISYRGSTGYSTGPHVHFEVRRYGALLFVPGYPGWYVGKGRAVPWNFPYIS